MSIILITMLLLIDVGLAIMAYALIKRLLDTIKDTSTTAKLVEVGFLVATIPVILFSFLAIIYGVIDFLEPPNEIAPPPRLAQGGHIL